MSLRANRGKLTLFFVILVLAMPFGCATAPLRSSDEPVIIKEMPFFSQEAYKCGPTALATVMDYWYRKTSTDKWVAPEEIAASLYSPSARGVLGLDLEVYARKQGFATEQYSGGLSDLKHHIDEGVPPIIFVDYGFFLYEVNHFMVVTGYTKDGVIVNSGRLQNQAVSDRELDRIWKKNRYWTLVLKPSA